MSWFPVRLPGGKLHFTPLMQIIHAEIFHSKIAPCSAICTAIWVLGIWARWRWHAWAEESAECFCSALCKCRSPLKLKPAQLHTLVQQSRASRATSPKFCFLLLLQVIVRSLWSSPPAYGARIVHTLLSDPQLRQQWEAEVKGMTETLDQRRKALLEVCQCNICGVLCSLVSRLASSK